MLEVELATGAPDGRDANDRTRAARGRSRALALRLRIVVRADHGNGRRGPPSVFGSATVLDDAVLRRSARRSIRRGYVSSPWRRIGAATPDRARRRSQASSRLVPEALGQILLAAVGTP